MKKVKNLEQIPDGAIFVTTIVLDLCASILHKAGLEAIRRRLNKREASEIPTIEDIVQMAEFVLKNNFIEFNGEVKRQKSGTAIGTTFAPLYACIFMDEVETEFLKSRELQIFYGFVTLTTYFLHGLTEHRNWILSLMSLKNYILS